MSDPTPTDPSAVDDMVDDDLADEPLPRPSPFEFRPDPRNPRLFVWRSPRGPALLAVARAIALGTAALLLGAAAPMVLSASALSATDAWALVGLLAVLAAVVAALSVHYAFDARGRAGNEIVLHPRHLELNLAAHRSLTEPTEHAADRIYYNDVQCIESRVEIYRVFGMPLRRRKFRLVPRNGEPVLLFEDRGRSTDDEASHAQLAWTIAERARAPIHDRGRVEGESGLLGIVGAAAPAWEVRGGSNAAAELPT